MKQGLLILGAVFCVALAIVLGSRMSVDATAVVVGVACGVLASVPTSLLLIWALNRRDQSAGGTAHSAQPGMGQYYPPIVVVNPGQGYARPGWGSAAYPPADDLPLPAGARQFKVIGEADTPGRAPERLYPGMGGREW